MEEVPSCSQYQQEEHHDRHLLVVGNDSRMSSLSDCRSLLVVGSIPVRVVVVPILATSSRKT